MAGRAHRRGGAWLFACLSGCFAPHMGRRGAGRPLDWLSSVRPPEEASRTVTKCPIYDGCAVGRFVKRALPRPVRMVSTPQCFTPRAALEGGVVVAIYGMRSGATVTLSLLWRLAWTAVGTSGWTCWDAPSRTVPFPTCRCSSSSQTPWRAQALPLSAWSALPGLPPCVLAHRASAQQASEGRRSFRHGQFTEGQEQVDWRERRPAPHPSPVVCR